MNNRLKWKVETNEKTFTTPIFDIYSQDETSCSGYRGKYVAIDCPDWVMIIPRVGDDFVLVRQWRHAEKGLTVEFPGGVSERGENPIVAAARELEEETGYVAEKLVKIGELNPNPAIFRNRVHFFYAFGLSEGKKQPDEDEFLEIIKKPIQNVLDSFGEDEFINGLMGTALALYIRENRKGNI